MTTLRTKIAALAVSGALAAGLGAVGFTQSASAASIATCTTMRTGSTGDCVRTLQTLLNASGAKVAVDGSYGPATTNAVLAFQKAHGLAVDGVAGPNTRAALAQLETPTNLFDARCDHALREGNRNGCVALLQKQLNAKGAKLNVDQSFGPATKAAVVAFQKSKGLTVDGVVGPATKAALGNKKPAEPKPPTDAAKRVVQNAEDALAGKAVPAGRLADGTPYNGWKGGKIPYAWGGGHPQLGPTPGQFYKDGFPMGHLGLDCSGFTRWVTARAYGKDLLGGGTATAQYEQMQPVNDPKPGDIVFFGRPGDFPHTGVYVGNGMMIHESNFAEDLIKSPVAEHSGKAYYARPKA